MQNLPLISFLIANPNTVLNAELTSRTEVKLNKRNNTLGTIYRVRTSIVTINGDYQKEVNTQRLIEASENNFKALKPVWGENLTKSLVKHNEQYYLQVIELGTKKSSVYYNENGDVVDKKVFEQFLPKTSSSSRQEVEDEVNVKKYKLANITQLIIRTPLVLVFN